MLHSEWNLSPRRREPALPSSPRSFVARPAGLGGADLPASLSARVDVLRALELLGHCTDGELLRLAAASQPRRVARGREVAGDRGEHGCVVLLRGLVKTTVARDGMDGELIVDVQGPGEVVDESCWSPSSRPRVGQAVAVGECAVLALSRRTLREVLAANGRVATRFLESEARRRVRASALVAQNASLDIAGRLYCRIVELAALRGAKTRAGIVVDHGLTQGELAAFANASRENVNRRLSAWKRRGWIEPTRRGLRVADPEALTASVCAEARRVGFGAGDGRLPAPSPDDTPARG